MPSLTPSMLLMFTQLIIHGRELLSFKPNFSANEHAERDSREGDGEAGDVEETEGVEADWVAAGAVAEGEGGCKDEEGEGDCKDEEGEAADGFCCASFPSSVTQYTSNGVVFAT